MSVCLFNLNNVGKYFFEMILWNNILLLSFVAYLCRCFDARKKLSNSYCNRKTNNNQVPVQYNSFLWVVERSSMPPTYLFGTVHAPKDLIWRYIPLNAKDAFNSASHVYTEVNLKDQKVEHAIQKCRTLPNGQTLEDVLPTELLERLKYTIKMFQNSTIKIKKEKITNSFFYIHQRQDFYNRYKRLRPSWLINTIFKEWNRYYIKSRHTPTVSLDRYLVETAIQRNVYKGGIEHVSSHCDPLNNLNPKMVNVALNVTLFAQEQRMLGKFSLKENDIRYVTNLYKCGNPLNMQKLSGLFRSLVDEKSRKKLEEMDRILYEELILKRNQEMSAEIEHLLNREDAAQMFFAVGAAHLLGNNSIVTLLRKRGYSVRHIPANESTQMETDDDAESADNVWEDILNRSKWKPKLSAIDSDLPPVVFINTEVKNTYVYYYNHGHKITRVSLPLFSLLLLVAYLLKHI